MNRLIVVLLLSYFSSFSQQARVDFYGTELTFKYDVDVVFRRELQANEKSFKKFYNRVEVSDTHILLDQLMSVKEELRLNDWLYYCLLTRLCTAIDKRERNSNFLVWYLLGKSGYTTNLSFVDRGVFVWVKTDEQIVNLAKYGNLHCLNCSVFGRHSYLNHSPFRQGRTFSFQFNPLPKLSDSFVTKKTIRLEFQNDSIHSIDLIFNNGLIEAERDRPNVSLLHTFSVPMSDSVFELIEVLNKEWENYNDSTKVTLVTKFAMRHSRYRSDERDFGREKWMTPEEFLYYGFGDCEDRSSFVFYALKEIVGKPLVILDYPNGNHVNLAISIELKSPPDFVYKGMPFYVIEPTVLGREPIPLGSAGKRVKEEKYSIVGEFGIDQE